MTETTLAAGDVGAKALEVHRRLCPAYQCPIPRFHDLDALSERVSSLLSHRTRTADSGRAFRRLRARVADRAAVRDASTSLVDEAIAPVTWLDRKAPHGQRCCCLRDPDCHRCPMLDLCPHGLARSAAWTVRVPDAVRPRHADPSG